MKSSEHRRRYEKFLARLKQARLEAGLTQQQAAKLLSKPQSYIAKCEAGERHVDFVELLEFASIYSKPLTFFQEGSTALSNGK